MKWRWLAVGTFVVVGGCSTALSIAAHSDAEQNYGKRTALLRAALKKHGSLLREDLKLLAKYPQLHQRAAGKDCGALLSKKVQLALPDLNEQGRPAYPTPTLPGLFDSSPHDFANVVKNVDVSHVDTSWMRELAACDQWEAASEPNATEARRWSLVRLVQAMHDDQGPEAGHDVENLARLLDSTEQPVFAYSLHELDRRAFDYAAANNLRTEGWAPLDVAALKALSRVTFSWGVLASPHASLDVVDADFFRSPDFAFARCPALAYGAQRVMEVEVLSDFYAPAHALIDEALRDTAGTCRLTQVRAAWGHPEQTIIPVGAAALCNPNNASCAAESLLSRFPGLREAFAEEVLESNRNHNDVVELVVYDNIGHKGIIYQ